MTNNSQEPSHSVSFNDAVLCIDTLHVNDYTDEEVFRTWFTDQEYKEIKREIKLTVAMMENNSKTKSTFTEGVHFSSRGLEDKTTDRLSQKLEIRYFAMDDVLDEQDRQREAGICDPEALSIVYAEYSFVSHMAAFLMATADEKVALENANDDDDATTTTTAASKSPTSPSTRRRKTSNTKSSPILSTPPQKSYPKVFRISPSHRVSMAA
mmetsp:Transcript_131725/g.196287  ORF Transcript_131725/g.196287 Transcript_131725/m.196287 type:complete len:210 (+) Transcript_131725:413-1042(+)